MKKLSFWIITDEVHVGEDGVLPIWWWGDNVKHIQDHLDLTVIRTYKLEKVLNFAGTPDYILIDTSVIDDCKLITPFVKAHENSIIRIVSWLYGTPDVKLDEVLKDIKYYAGPDAMLEMGLNGAEPIAKYVQEKILQYFPKKG